MLVQKEIMKLTVHRKFLITVTENICCINIHMTPKPGILYREIDIHKRLFAFWGKDKNLFQFSFVLSCFAYQIIPHIHFVQFARSTFSGIDRYHKS